MCACLIKQISRSSLEDNISKQRAEVARLAAGLEEVIHHWRTFLCPLCKCMCVSGGSQQMAVGMQADEALYTEINDEVHGDPGSQGHIRYCLQARSTLNSKALAADVAVALASKADRGNVEAQLREKVGGFAPHCI